jgi:site-specific DNA-methyltransferase (adenine-specific)
MKPYYSDDNFTVYHGDCRVILPQLRDKIDLVLTDPPYGTKNGCGKVTKRRNELVEFNVGEWDTHLLLDWIPMAMELLKNGHWFICFTDNLEVKSVWDEISKCGGNGKQIFFWIKTNPPPQPRMNFRSGVESVVCATKGAVRAWNGGGVTLNYLPTPIVTASTRTVHPTEKPVTLFSHLIRLTTNECDTILDPFLGSGTALVAAKNLGRRGIGIEQDENYCEIAVDRLRQEVIKFKLNKHVEMQTFNFDA